MKRTLIALLTSAMLTAPALAPASAQDSGRTQQLEEQVRQLTGRIEEMSYQLLQMEERMRKMQEDNEFRFQELEGAGETKPKEKSAVEPQGGEGLEKPEPAAAPEVKTADKKPAKTGTLKFDDDGKLVAGPGLKKGSGQTSALPKAPASPFASADDAIYAAADFGSTPDAVFARGRELYRSEKFSDSAKAFRAHVGAWPKDGREAEARYWLGQSLFRQGDYYDAASALLDAHNRFPDAKTAPDALLALGLSLAGLEQREVACATYAEVLKRYPKAKARLGEQVKAEQASTRC